jgi:hypothetical protein
MTLTLENPGKGEITGLSQITVVGPAIAPTVACRIPEDQMDLARLVEGIPVGLSQPSAEPVSVLYVLEDSHGTLSSGTLDFAVGQSLRFVSLAGIDPANHDFLRFALSDPVAAGLGDPSAVYLVEAATTVPPPNETIISRGATWRYRADASAAPVGWQTTDFNDASWPSGPAQLGFGEGDQATLIPDNNQITSYFRHAFTVEDASAFSELQMWMLRDDGALVYLNGMEVFRSPNVPAGPISYNNTTVSPNGENTIDTAAFSAAGLISGVNVLAVEMHQQSSTSSDVSFDFELTGVPLPDPPPPQTIHLGQFDGQWTLAWGDDSFLLQTATSVEGPWSPSSATSPFVFTIDPAEPNMFFRLIRNGQ